DAAAFASGAPADVVIGQPDFKRSDCNLGGAGYPPNASALCGPKGVAVDAAGDLYVADTNNNRVLEYDTPISNGQAAARVFGQTSSTVGVCFSTPAANLLCGPSGVALDGSGKLYIADTTNNRVLEYDTPLTNQSANIV